MVIFVGKFDQLCIKLLSLPLPNLVLPFSENCFLNSLVLELLKCIAKPGNPTIINATS